MPPVAVHVRDLAELHRVCVLCLLSNKPGPNKVMRLDGQRTPHQLVQVSDYMLALPPVHQIGDPSVCQSVLKHSK